MNEVELQNSSDSNRHAALVIAVLIAIVAGAFFFGFIPNTDPYQKRAAKSVVSQMMIDPSAAKFGSVSVFHNSKGHFVCGGVNGKNRMGAYSGEVRFISEVGISRATLDPQVTTSASDAQQARLICNKMKAIEYASQSTIDSICTNASDYESNLAEQALFENEWNSQCVQ